MLRPAEMDMMYGWGDGWSDWDWGWGMGWAGTPSQRRVRRVRGVRRLCGSDSREQQARETLEVAFVWGDVVSRSSHCLEATP